VIEKQKETLIYLLATYAITALSWGTLAVLQLPATGSTAAVILYLLGGFSTAIVAFVIALTRRKDERRAYLRRFFRFGISARWYVVTVVAAVLVVGVAYGTVRALFPDDTARLSIQPLYLVVPYFFMMVFGGGIEEFGWRGIVVHNMRRMNPFAISAIVGVIWFVWHLPLFFIVGVGQYQTSVLAFSMGLLGYSFVTTALYLKTESVVPCVIFHALINAFAELGFWMAADTRLSYWDGAIRLVAGLLIFAAIVYAPKRSTESGSPR
jgi:uncharacterized protein